MKKFNKKGFTLTELIVVIVIIGILAVIITPSVMNYIDKARLANDKTDVRNMNMILSTRAYEENFEYLLSDEVVRLLEVEGFSLDARAKDYYYFYDVNNNKMVLKKLVDGAFETEAVNVVVTKLSATSPRLVLPSERVKDLDEDGMLYIDNGNKNISDAIDIVTNLFEKAKDKAAEMVNYDNAFAALFEAKVNGENTTEKEDELEAARSLAITEMISLMKELINEAKELMPENMNDVFEGFSPDRTLYVDDKGYYFEGSTSNYNSVVITKATVVIPELPDNITGVFNITTPIYLPERVVNVSNESFLKNVEPTKTYIVITNENLPRDQLSGFTVSTDVKKEYDISNLENVDNAILYVIKCGCSETTCNHTVKEYTFTYTGLAVGIVEGGIFTLKFKENASASSIIPEDGSFEVKQGTDTKNGCHYYELRIYDKDGVLKKLGTFKYYYIVGAISFPIENN